MQNNASTRERWIDVVKGIAMFMVVLGHSGKSTYYESLYFIHLPTFLAISGYLLAMRGHARNPLRMTIRKKAADIMFPYLMFGSMFLTYRFFKCAALGTEFSLKPLLLNILLLQNNANWFLPPLFCGEIMLVCLEKLLEKIKISKRIYPPPPQFCSAGQLRNCAVI